MKDQKDIPDFVAISKNHCHNHLVYPATKKTGKHKLSEKLEIDGIAYFNSEGEITYALGFNKLRINGKLATTLNKFDGQVLFGLLALLQFRNKKRKKEKVFDDTAEDNYTFTFRSTYELLQCLKIPTNNPLYYERVEEALFKIRNITLYFQNSFYSPEKKRIIKGRRVFGLFDSLDYWDGFDEESGYQIEIVMSKKWVDMHDHYFVLRDLEVVKSLSEIELNLSNLLEPWWEEILAKGKRIKRDLKEVCQRIGYAESTPSRLRVKLKTLIKNINIKCGYDYAVKFEKNNVTFYSEDD